MMQIMFITLESFRSIYLSEIQEQFGRHPLFNQPNLLLLSLEARTGSSDARLGRSLCVP